MIKSIEEKKHKSVEIDLTGPDGNVFYLIGQGRKFCNQLNLDSEVFTSKMMSGDYENAVNVFEQYFGSFVILYR
jgi:hypothetical protein